jgi:chaperonin GroES
MIQPIGPRLIVERDEAPDTSPGGIVLPQSSKDLPRRAVVVALGTGVKEPIEVGDVVLTSLHAGKPVDEKNPRLQFIMEEHILGIERG